jgi:hypothetical protein
MAVTVQQESGGLSVMRIKGLLKKSELDAVQAAAAKQFSAQPDIRVKLLMIIENFEGWEGGVDWGDMSFYAAYGDRIMKIAIVADPKREADLMMFMGAGIRPSPIKFFPPEQIAQARAWLA